jgi:hypothetical protein
MAVRIAKPRREYSPFSDLYMAIGAWRARSPK